jgi:hypothetical protein
MGCTCSTHGYTRNSYIFVGKQGRRLHVRPKNKRDDDIKMDLKEMVGWIFVVRWAVHRALS